MADNEQVVTPKFRASFPNLFTPVDRNGTDKYDMVMLFPKDEDLSKLKQLVKDTAMEKWGKIPKPFTSPFKDGNEKDLEKYPSFEDTVYISAATKFQPGVVDQKKQEIFDEAEFYAGCYARAAVTTFPWEFKGKKGVSFNLNFVQKLADGEKLGGGRAGADDVFDVVETETSKEEDDFDLG